MLKKPFGPSTPFILIGVQHPLMEYATLCETYHAIEQTSKRLEKTAHIAALLLQANTQDLAQVVLLLQGRVFSAVDKQTLGISSRLTLKALSRVTGASTTELEKDWSKTGDLGLIAENRVDNKSQQTLFSASLTVNHVFNQLKRLAQTEGKNSVDTKLKLLSELLSNASPREAKYLVRTVLEELRIGIATQTLRDGITLAFLPEHAGITNGEITDRESYNKTTAIMQSAYDKTNDFAIVAQTATKGLDALQEIHLTVGTPLKVMLGVRGTLPDAFTSFTAPILLQYKYDGFRVQIHKQQDTITIYTRRLEDVTTQFPDIVERAKAAIKADNAIIDAEAIGIDPETRKYKPFQEISQRIRRKYGIQEMAEKLPVDVRCFDVMLADNEEYLDKTLRERHEILQKLIKEEELFGIAHTLITEDQEQAQTFYDTAIAAGEEGIFAKHLESVYQPGTRVGNWMKIKHTMEPLDLVIVSAEWGEGKRSGWLTSFTVACQDENGELKETGKVATGLKELEEEGFSFKEMTALLTPLIEFEEGRYVKVQPQIIVEVAYDEIQQSPTYESGYALRFPRILRNRTDDKTVDDISNIDYITSLYDAE